MLVFRAGTTYSGCKKQTVYQQSVSSGDYFRGLAFCFMEGEGAIKSLQSWCFSQQPGFKLRANAV